MRLYFIERQICQGSATKYVFLLDGKELKLDRAEARQLIETIPAEQRNCKMSFCEVKLKASVAKQTTVATVYGN